MVNCLPNFVILSYSLSSLKAIEYKMLKALSLEWHPVAYPLIIFFLVLVLPYFIQNHKEGKDEMKNKILTSLLSGISVVVNDKSQRFHKTIHNTENTKDKISKDEIFTTITQPQEQVRIICQVIFSFFKEFVNEGNLKFILVSCSSGRFIRVINCTSADDTSKTLPSFLNHKTMAKDCADKKKILIMECKGDKNVQFYESRKKKSNINSMITYPICNEETTRYVLCLSSHEEFTFKNRDKKVYELILKEFGKRIILESYLNDLKNLS